MLCVVGRNDDFFFQKFDFCMKKKRRNFEWIWFLWVHDEFYFFGQIKLKNCELNFQVWLGCIIYIFDIGGGWWVKNEKKVDITNEFAMKAFKSKWLPRGGEKEAKMKNEKEWKLGKRSMTTIY